MRRQQSGDRKPRWNIGEQSGKAMTKTFENAEPNVEWLLSKQRRLQNYCKHLTEVALLLSLFPSNNPRIRFQIREGAWKLYIGSINWIERRIDHKIQPIFARYIMQNDAERRSCVIDITVTHRDSFSRFTTLRLFNKKVLNKEKLKMMMEKDNFVPAKKRWRVHLYSFLV